MTSDTKQRTTFFLTPSLVKHARAQAVVEEITLTQLVEIALVEYLPSETVFKKSELPVGVSKRTK